jgi:DNA-binding transcriptional regulator YhcF (GntR family)
MITFGREYFSNNTYFFLKKKDNKIDVYYSVNETINEARQFDEVISLPVKKEKSILSLVEKVIKSKKKFTKDNLKKLIDKINPKGEEKEEIDELIDFDGTLLNSKIPIHDPKMSPRKTMDQTVFAVGQPRDPLTRGYRVYYGESVVREEDLTGAFGYDVVSGDTYEDCVEKMTQMEVENPEERCQAFGKSPKLDQKGQERLTEKQIKEVQRQKMIGMLEDLIVKKSEDSDIRKKQDVKKVEDLPHLVGKNLKNLLRQMDKNGVSKNDIIKLIRDEQ